MPYIMRITSDGDFMKAINALKGLRNMLPKMEKEAMREWGKVLERDIKRSAVTAGIKDFTGNLQNRGIRYEQSKTGKIGKLFIAQYGVYLDAMAPHPVYFKQSRGNLLRWGMQASNASVRRKANKVNDGESWKGFSPLYVRPHPFIRAGFKRARPKLNRIIRKKTTQALMQSIGGTNV